MKWAVAVLVGAFTCAVANGQCGWYAGGDWPYCANCPHNPCSCSEGGLCPTTSIVCWPIPQCFVSGAGGTIGPLVMDCRTEQACSPRDGGTCSTSNPCRNTGSPTNAGVKKYSCVSGPCYH